ncbi:MAG: ribosome-binding factor A [Planctomycetota bacterium]
MGNKTRRDAAWRDLCVDFELEDSELQEHHDTHGLHRHRQRSQKKQKDVWRSRRLCGQVRKLIQMGLADCSNPRLQSLVVITVEPTDRRAFLEVTVAHACADEANHSPHAREVMAHLAAATPRLRHELAKGLSRKKTPQLIFRLQNRKEHNETFD